jgi:Fur family transcriptional regulator, ferric uptake regulator
MTRKPLSPATILRDSGLRRTPVRAAVLELLTNSDFPLGVTDMLGKLPAETDAVTVYRTLNTFTRKKIVHRIQSEDRSWRYALGNAVVRKEHRHPHFVCEKCQNVECLDDAEIPKALPKSMGVGRGYTVSYPEVVLHGICPRCR